ncbi:2-hydroxychromene-2-carboxylate isomerase [soil metagenome]
MTENIEYFFSITSPWAYLGVERLIALAGRMQVQITPRLIGAVEENGWIPLKKKPPIRQRYVAAEIGRWSRYLGIPIQQSGRPATLKDATPAAMMVIAADLTGAQSLQLAVALQRAFWEKAIDIGDPQVRRAVADAAGYDGQRLLDGEADAAVEQRWQDNKARAMECGVFGSPTYAFAGELYWGQDRLDFLERHLAMGTPI